MMPGLRSLSMCLLAVLLCAGSANGDPSPGTSYETARWDPIHFRPAIENARDEQCLACHQDILSRRVLPSSPAGVKASESFAWYQTLNTYTGEQDTFHRRHGVGDYAQQVMDMKCNTCHQGNDPRDETANSSATGDPDLIQRKLVNPTVCLMCHGQFKHQVMGIPGPWPESSQMFNNSCLTCHAAVRTNRHRVNFLKPEGIEEAGRKDSDVCYGCHGGRAWYRISYPYPRHPWPGMPDEIPDWAKDRPTKSAARFVKGTD